MAGGLVYTALESTSMATAEIYGKTLVKLGEQNPKIVALTADLKGSTKIGDFAAKFPERTINVGIAEQNMYGMAAGLAKCGFIPFASSFSVFASLRALDQIHTDICYQNVNVKIIGTQGGLHPPRNRRLRGYPFACQHDAYLPRRRYRNGQSG